MAPHHGGQPSPPRAHRPRAPIMSVPVPLTAPLAPLRPNPPPLSSTATITANTTTTSSTTTTTAQVTLTAPRPENERAANEYVETPFRSPTHPAATPPTPPPAHHHHHPQRPQRLPLQLPVTKQPTSFGKDAAASSMVGTECTARSSIMCPDCGRCRCVKCSMLFFFFLGCFFLFCFIVGRWVLVVVVILLFYVRCVLFLALRKFFIWLFFALRTNC